jgi:dihydropteroate synthase
MYSINCKGHILTLNQPKVMGIINCTPDSFYDGNPNNLLQHHLQQASEMLEEGADILDVGGQSSRPGSSRIEADEEINRVIPVIEAIVSNFPNAIISIDTYHQKVAEYSIRAGASMVNDISAGELDPNMSPWAGEQKIPYICMHMKGSPETMQQNPVYNNVTTEVLDYFIAKLDACKKAGIVDVIIDPGFGFGKSYVHNVDLLKNLGAFSMLNCPILVGVSRKGMIYKTLNITPDQALNGTTVLNTIALLNGSSILRVHDVKEAKEAIVLTEQFRKRN